MYVLYSFRTTKESSESVCLPLDELPVGSRIQTLMEQQNAKYVQYFIHFSDLNNWFYQTRIMIF